MNSKDKGTSAISCAAVFIVAAYAGLQMLSDIASLKIGAVAGLAVDMGTFIYPLTFTLRDMAHKLLGKKSTRTLVITTGAVNLFMAVYLWLCTLATPATTWPLQEEFTAVLGPVWRIVIASIIAEIASELVDTEVYHWFRSKTARHQWARVLLSNCISIPIDNFIFTFGAFIGVVSIGAVWQIFMMNLIVKAVVGIGGIPLIYLVPDKYDRFDELDRKDPPDAQP